MKAYYQGYKRKFIDRMSMLFVVTISFLVGSFTALLTACDSNPVGAAKAMEEYYLSPAGNDMAEGTKEKPLRSIKGAFNAIKANKADFSSSNITIRMASGEYFVTDADEAVIESDDLPKGVSITVKAEDGATPIINGGKKITDWKEERLNGKTVFVSQLEKGLENVYSLKVNGVSADIAKSIDEPFDGRYLSPQNSHGAPFAEGSFSWDYIDKKDKSRGIKATNNLSVINGLKNPSNVQAVWLIEWKEFLINVDSIKDACIYSDYWKVIAGEINVSNGAQYFWPCPTHRFYLQNDVSLITREGEFCYDKRSGKICYCPRDGETIQNTVGEIPLASKLITLRGKDGSPIENVSFEGLTFKNTAVDYIDEYGGFAINQAQQFESAPPTGSASAPVYNRTMMGGAITLEHCKNVVFSGCTFDNVGLTALVMDKGSQSCVVEGCVFKDLGNCAVVVSNLDFSAKGNNRVLNNVIKNNVIRRIGCINKSSPAILVHYANGTIVRNNDIYDCPYTGISVGWGWAKLNDSYAGNNMVLQNRVGNYLTVLKDGGGVYTLGNQPGSLVEYNYFYSQRNNIAGVYLDEATSGFTVRYNAFYLNDLTDDKGYLIKPDYCNEIPSMYWINLNDNSGKAGTAESVMSDIKVVSNFYFMKNGYGKTDANSGNIIPPIVNDDASNPSLRNVEYTSRADFLSSDNVKKILSYAGLTAEYKFLLSKV
ncbi:MAG: right-handed parallel beta-helix repeat-containing protein [Clostridia bacterium]|nr:right-handed parallel beta-helix repeat-containing protein [Clostridia bacterium]